jgi:hypothetical protein
VPQQTGVLLKHRQQVQPASMHSHMQSQQAWIMAQQALSPLVQVTHTPSLVYSHLQMAIAMLHWHMHIPFIMQQQLHMPSQSILQRFCKVAQATSSSQMHLIFIPPAHFSIFIVQRGRTIAPAAAGIGAAAGVMGISPIPGPIIPRFIIITLAMVEFLSNRFHETSRAPRALGRCPLNALRSSGETSQRRSPTTE